MEDQFEAYFKIADLNHDGRISGPEALSFFPRSGLSRPVLAQIWRHVDKNSAGFLCRQEFYNALKLVTVAQSKRDLAPEIVKATLYGPDSATIPPPKINLFSSLVLPSTSASSAPGLSSSGMGGISTGCVGGSPSGGPSRPTSASKL